MIKVVKTAATLIAICAIALLLRVVPPYYEIFRGNRVVFAGNDPWIEMRDTDNIAAHWPLPSWFDPYRLAPEGEWTEAPLMDILIAGIARATRIPIDVAGAWFPAVCGALIPMPIFFFTRRLFGNAEAVIASMLIAILPGSLLQRTLLGVTDHNVLEALLSVCTLLFLALGQSIAAGIFLGLYLLAWARGAFFVLILIAWAILAPRHPERMSRHPERMSRHPERMSRHPERMFRHPERSEGSQRQRSFAVFAAQDDVARVLSVTFAIAFLVALPVAIHLPPMDLTLPTLAGGITVVLIADRIPRRAAIAMAIVCAVAAFLVMPDLVTQARRFLPSGAAMTVGEVQPMLIVSGHFSLRPLWFELTTASVLAVIGFALAMRDRTPQKMLLLVFAALVTAATLAQVRFGYYLAIAAAILASVAAVRFLWRDLNKIFGTIVIAAIVIYPNVPLALAVAKVPEPGPSDGWLQAFDWMRMHTPEPFASADEYFARHDSKRDTPDPKYGVMVWSDYGWWLSRIARRPPSTNPTQVAVKEAAQFYLATTEAEALKILQERKAKYVIADRSMPMTIAGAGQIMSSQLEPMARWAEKDASRLYEVALDHGRPLFVYYPDYYRTMAVRLFGYDGKAFTPKGTSWAIELDAKNNIVDARRFQTYEAAAAFVGFDPKHWRVAGLDPLVSCVPLEPLVHFAQVFVSPKHDVKVFVLR